MMWAIVAVVVVVVVVITAAVVLLHSSGSGGGPGGSTGNGANVILASGTSWELASGANKAQAFTVTERSIVTGNWSASVRAEAFIVNASNYQNFSKDLNTPIYDYYGNATLGSMNTIVGAGSYDVGFYNFASGSVTVSATSAIEWAPYPA